MIKSHTFRNGVMLFTAFLEGYGSPAEDRAWAIFDNRVLAKFVTEGSTAVRIERWRVRYSKLTKDEVAHLAKNKPQFVSCCDQCQKPLYEGWCSQGYLLRCGPCNDKMGYKEAEAIPEVLARAKLRSLIAQRKARKLRERQATQRKHEE